MFTNGQEITATIYCLKYNGEVIYVGCTTKTLEDRFYSHKISCRANQTTPLYEFLFQHTEDVTIEPLETVEFKYDNRFGLTPAYKVETFWIKEFNKKKQGKKLLNHLISGKSSKNDDRIAANHQTVLSENLRMIRRKKGLTQEQVAEIMNIKRSLLGAYEEGRAEPRTETLFKFCELYGIEDIKEMFVDRYNIKSKSAKAA